LWTDRHCWLLVYTLNAVVHTLHYTVSSMIYSCQPCTISSLAVACTWSCTKRLIHNDGTWQPVTKSKIMVSIIAQTNDHIITPYPLPFRASHSSTPASSVEFVPLSVLIILQIHLNLIIHLMPNIIAKQTRHNSNDPKAQTT
jgi:hypothetical protein